jgi:hypothetical protein
VQPKRPSPRTRSGRTDHSLNCSARTISVNPRLRRVEQPEHAPEPSAWAFGGDRGVHGGLLSVRPAPPVRGGCGGCVPGFWMEQAQADEAPVVIDALDDVSVQLELGDDGGREVNPAGVQLGKSDPGWSPASRSRSSSSCCWASASVIDRLVPSSRLWAPRAFPSRAAATGRLWVGVWSPPTAASPPQSTHALCDRGHRVVTFAHSAAARLEHGSNAWLATSANSTRSTSVREPPGRAPCDARSTPRRPTARRAALPRPAAAKQRPRTPPARPAAAPRRHQSR